MRKSLFPFSLLFFFACGEPPTAPCSPDNFVIRCDGSSLVLCGGTNEVFVDCGDAACNANEQRCGVCGDAIEQGSEECDDGNTVNGDNCSSICQSEICGNGRLDNGEECDDGNTVDADGCQGDCTLPNCGDGFIDPGEECDDGNQVNTDQCTNLCRLPACGDTFVQAGEQCDDGNQINDAVCSADCTLPSCGDGIRAANEGCDDGNNTSGDGCQADCTLPACGDGSLDPGEGCDDGNQINTDDCPSICQLASCGDTFVQANVEECDDGNNINDLACNADCTLPACGNGVVDANEACDDGNIIDNDGCDGNCTLAACGNGVVNTGEECDDGNQDNDDGCTNQCFAIAFAAQQAPRSSALAISEDDSTVAMTNTDTGTVSFFDTQTNTRISELLIAADSEPWAVAITPDSSQAIVLLRKTGALVEVNDITSPTPSISRTLAVGAEPTGLVLSPSGRIAYVASFVEGAVYVIDTQSFTVIDILIVGANPRGLCMTNDGDADDFDETLFVTQYFGLPSGIVKPGVLPLDSGSEGTDFGRKGVVHAISTADNTIIQNVDLLPLDVTGFQNGGVDSGAYPNMMANCTVNNGHVYVPNMASSPRGPVVFNTNVQSFVSVFDTATLTEVPGNNVGQRSGTVNLNNLIKTQSADAQGRQFFTLPSDIAFLPGTDFGFAVSSASDYVMPVEWRSDGTIVLSPLAGTFHIPMNENPIGMVIDSAGQFGYVANRVSRNLKVVNLAAQTVAATIVSAAVPIAGQPGFNELKGFKFFNTSGVRWSKESWGSCTACHPDGLSDNATWHFAAGPRQTVPMDGTFSKTDPTDQRILNWTGIFDEVHDFNANTLNVSGAINNPVAGAAAVMHPGAIVRADGGDADVSDDLINVAAVDTDGQGVCSNNANIACTTANELLDCGLGNTCVLNENHAGLNGGVGLVVDTVSIKQDWNQIEAYLKTVRPMEASRLLDSVAVARGRAVFINNKCQDCHGGSKWTISRRSFTPNLGNASATVSASNTRKTTVISNSLGILNQNNFLNSAETVGFVSPYDSTLVVQTSAATALNRITCVLRDVGTFGLVDPATGTRDNRIEVNAGMVQQAQGIQGFNPPSLLSLSVTAPYLHHGLPQSLEELFSPAFTTHHQAASANFLESLNDSNANNDAQSLQDRADLIAFLLSIDLSTAIIQPTAGQDICPNL